MNESVSKKLVGNKLTVNYSIHHSIRGVTLVDVWDALREIREKGMIDGVQYMIELLEDDRVTFSGKRDTNGLPTIISKLINALVGDIFTFQEGFIMEKDRISVNSYLTEDTTVFLNIRTYYTVTDTGVDIFTRIRTGVESSLLTFFPDTVAKAILSVLRKKVSTVRSVEYDFLQTRVKSVPDEKTLSPDSRLPAV